MQYDSWESLCASGTLPTIVSCTVPFLNPLIWSLDLKRYSNFLTVGGRVFLHSVKASDAFCIYSHLQHFRCKNAWDVNEPAFNSLCDEWIRPLWRASHQRGQKNSHLSVINKGLMEVVYQMKTADCLQEKSWRNFSSFRCHLASRQFARHILSVCVVRVSDVTRPAAGCDSSSGVGVSRQFTAAWIRLADTVIAFDGSYSRAGTCFVTSLRHPQRLTTLSLRRVKSFSRLSLESTLIIWTCFLPC